MDNMISPGYLKDQFMNTFRPIENVLENCGIYFSVSFSFFKLFIDVAIMIIRQLERIAKTGAALEFGTTLLNVYYNVFRMSIFTSMYDRRPPTLAAVEKT